MKFKESKYYNKDFLGENLYNLIYDDDEVHTVREYFNINSAEKEYLKKGSSVYGQSYRYKLKINNNYYELDCQQYDSYLYLVFDKPVHIVGEYCTNIIAPEIVVKSSKNKVILRCIANKILVDNDSKYECYMHNSKVNNIDFYNSVVKIRDTEINNFFILNKRFKINKFSEFLEHHKIKFFGKSNNLKKKILNNENFKKGIIHIE